MCKATKTLAATTTTTSSSSRSSSSTQSGCVEQTGPTRPLTVSLNTKHTKISTKVIILQVTCSQYCQCCLLDIVLASVCAPSCSARIPNDILNCLSYCFSSSTRMWNSPSPRPQRMQWTKTSWVSRRNLTAHSSPAVSVGWKHFCRWLGL